MGPLAQANRTRIARAESGPRLDSRIGESIPAWLYPQVMSLDAPAVAVAWQWLFAKAFHVAITPAELFVTAGCVWMIYAADHLLDVRARAIYSARHRFVRRHPLTFVIAFTLVFAAAAVAAFDLSLAIWRGGLILSAGIALYLGVVHWGGDMVRRYWPKEFAIGAVFAAGSSIATWSHPEAARQAWPAIALFAALCTLNCCAVDFWEWQANHVLLRYPHRLTRWVARHFLVAAMAIIVLGACLLLFAPHPVIFSLLLSAMLLMVVGAARNSLSPEAARLLADAVLLTPVLFLLR